MSGTTKSVTAARGRWAKRMADLAEALGDGRLHTSEPRYRQRLKGRIRRAVDNINREHARQLDMFKVE